MNDFYVAASHIHGLGCFTRVPIKKGDRVWFNVLPVRKPHNLDHHTFPLDRESSCVVLSPFSYCNHSIDPNFRLIKVDHIERMFTFEALRDLEIYSEITLEYT